MMKAILALILVVFVFCLAFPYTSNAEIGISVSYLHPELEGLNDGFIANIGLYGKSFPFVYGLRLGAGAYSSILNAEALLVGKIRIPLFSGIKADISANAGPVYLYSHKNKVNKLYLEGGPELSLIYPVMKRKYIGLFVSYMFVTEPDFNNIRAGVTFKW